MQETQEFTLPISNKQVIVRGYITGKIDSEVKAIIAEGNKTSFEAPVASSTIDNVSSDNIPEGSKVVVAVDPTAQQRADDKLLELMVSSLDSNTGDVFNRVMDLPASDVSFIRSQINAIKQRDEVAADDPKAPKA